MNYSKEKVFKRDSSPFALCQTLELSQGLVDAKKDFFTSCVLFDIIMLSTFECKLPINREQKKEYESDVKKISAVLACRNFSVDIPEHLNILGIKIKSVESYFFKIQQPNSLPLLSNFKQQFLDPNKCLKKAFSPITSTSVSEIFRFEVINNIKSYDKLIKDADEKCYVIINQKLVMKTKDVIQSLHDTGLRVYGSLTIIVEQIDVYFNELLGAIKSLQKMVELLIQMFICKSRISDYIFLRCRTLNLKIQILRNEICNATYTKDIVNCHKKIHQYLNKKIENVHSQLEFTEHSLRSYEDLGQSYKDLVEEYTLIRDKIKKEKWAIKELEKKN